MAEGLLRYLAGDRFEAVSAGVEAGSLRPEAVQVMHEIGIDISRQRSKIVDQFAGEQFDLVITTCDEAREACPLFPGARRMLHWSLPDPASVTGPRDERIEAFRRVRNGLQEQVKELVRSVTAERIDAPSG